MKKPLYQIFVAAITLVTASAVFAKLPALSDEAKAKAAEASAKTAWSGKVDGFLLCKAQDKAASHYLKTAKDTKPAVATPPCADPGPFVYTPAVAAPPAATPAAAPASAAEPAKKS